MNRGLVMGFGRSRDRFSCVVDIDNPVSLRLADYFLPPTGMTGGRESVPFSHRFYWSEQASPTKRLTFPGTGMLVELLGRGSQVLVAPSIHPSGEPYVMSGAGNAANAKREELLSAIAWLAIASLARIYLEPSEGLDFCRGLGMPQPVGVWHDIAPELQQLKLENPDLLSRTCTQWRNQLAKP